MNKSDDTRNKSRLVHANMMNCEDDKTEEREIIYKENIYDKLTLSPLEKY